MGPILGGTPFLKFDSSVKIICDGNSLTAGYAASLPYPQQMAALPPFNGNVTVVNTGISGQSTQAMRADTSDVGAAYDNSKTMVLVAWEGTNSLAFGGTARASADELALYVLGMMTLHPNLRIVLPTLIPRQRGTSEADDIDFNINKIDAYNTILRAEALQWGAKAVCDLRQPGSPWSAANFPDYTRATFAASAAQGWWAAGEDDAHIHCADKGYGSAAAQIGATVRRLKRR